MGSYYSICFPYITHRDFCLELAIPQTNRCEQTCLNVGARGSGTHGSFIIEQLKWSQRQHTSTFIHLIMPRQLLTVLPGIFVAANVLQF